MAATPEGRTCVTIYCSSVYVGAVRASPTSPLPPRRRRFFLARLLSSFCVFLSVLVSLPCNNSHKVLSRPAGQATLELAWWTGTAVLPLGHCPLRTSFSYLSSPACLIIRPPPILHTPLLITGAAPPPTRHTTPCRSSMARPATGTAATPRKSQVQFPPSPFPSGRTPQHAHPSPSPPPKITGTQNRLIGTKNTARSRIYWGPTYGRATPS